MRIVSLAIVSLATLSTLFALVGCAAVSPSSSDPITPQTLTGNWQMSATSTASKTTGTVTPFSIYLIANNGTVTGTLFPQAAYPVFACPFPSAQLAGTVDAQGNISMKSVATPTGAPIVVTLTGLAASGAMVGSYTISGGCASDMGTVAGTELPPLNGTYNGTVTSTNTGTTMTVKATLTQASTPNAAGQLPVTGTASFSGGQSCLSSLAVQNSESYLYGTDLLTGLAVNPAAPLTAGFSGTLSADGKTLSITYDVSPDVCSYDFGKGTLTLQ
jgi:hypothetical protein